jgi:hypothetical protein
LQKKIVLLIGLCFMGYHLVAQDSSVYPNTGLLAMQKTDTAVVLRYKKPLVLGTHALFLVGSSWVLNKAWYANYPTSRFHLFNDNKEWNQMDKIGHWWTAYRIARTSAATWQWAGYSTNKSILYGGLSALAYQTSIEIQDGFSAQWGFSWGDMAANFLGVGSFAAQQWAWKEQRVQIKMGYSTYSYPQNLMGRRDQLFGKRFLEQVLKDYNGQTYWLSGNIHSFFTHAKIPKWLNLAVGYSSDGLLGGFENKWTENAVVVDRSDIARVRRYYFSVDADFTKIKTHKKWVRTVFFILSAVKIPAPTLMVDGNGKWKGYAFYY